MQNSQRVLIITRQFWPTTNDHTLRLRQQVRQLRQAGLKPYILTPRWHRSWPDRVTWEETQVQRVDPPPLHSVGQTRYHRALLGWIHRIWQPGDAIYCDAPESEAQAILRNFAGATSLSQRSHEHRLRPRVTVRFDPREIRQDARALQSLPEHIFSTCRLADRVLVPNALAHQLLICQAIDGPNIHRVFDATGMRLDRSRQSRDAARKILAETNHDLFVRPKDRLVVCPGELNHEWGIEALIRGLACLLDRNRELKLWLLGNGPTRDSLYELLQDLGLQRIVAMPGEFCDPQVVLQAADLCVFPAVDVGLRWLLPTCAHSGIPFMTILSPESRLFLGNEYPELCIADNKPSSMGQWIAGWFGDPQDVRRASDRLRGTHSHETSDWRLSPQNPVADGPSLDAIQDPPRMSPPPLPSTSTTLSAARPNRPWQAEQATLPWILSEADPVGCKAPQ